MNCSLKWALFNKSIQLHKKLANKHGLDIGIIDANKIMINKMDYDKVSAHSVAEKTLDYTRCRTLELCAEEIERNAVEGHIAEAGVFMGDFSWLLEKCFPERKIYLYDTFEGFDQKDIDVENEMFEEGAKWLNITKVSYQANQFTADEQITFVKNRLAHPENAIIRKGFFPGSAREDTNVNFAFVSLDMDLYKPILEGILFFYPRLSAGGYMFIHDYNCSMLKDSTHKAISDAENILGKLSIVPISDIGGTIVVFKPC